MAHIDLVTSVVHNRDLRHLAESGFERVTRKCAWPPGHSAIFSLISGTKLLFTEPLVRNFLVPVRSFASVCVIIFLMYWHLSKNWMTFYSRNLKFWGFFSKWSYTIIKLQLKSDLCFYFWSSNPNTIFFGEMILGCVCSSKGFQSEDPEMADVVIFMMEILLIKFLLLPFNSIKSMSLSSNLKKLFLKKLFTVLAKIY